MLVKLKSAIPWILLVLALGYAAHSEIRHAHALKSAQDQITALQSVKDKAADLAGEQAISIAEDEIKEQVKRESNSTTLTDFVHELNRRSGDAEGPSGGDPDPASGRKR